MSVNESVVRAPRASFVDPSEHVIHTPSWYRKTPFIFVPTERKKMKTNILIFVIVQELCESRGGRPGLRPNESSGFRGRKAILNHASALGHSLSLICQLTSEDIKHHFII